MTTTFILRLAAVSFGLATVASLGLTSCGNSLDGQQTEGVEPTGPASQPVEAKVESSDTDEPVLHKTAAPKAVHFEGELVFAKRQFSVLRSTTTYQEGNLCRWTLQPVGEGAASQTMTFRWNDLLFQRPPGKVQSAELQGANAMAKLGELELIRAAMFWPDAPRGLQPWDVQGMDADSEGATDRAKPASTLRLLTATMDDLGSVLMTYDELTDQQVFRWLPLGEADGVSLAVLERFDIAGRSWPKSMSLAVGGELLWTQTVTSLNVQSWFGEKFFLPLEHQGRLDAAEK